MRHSVYGRNFSRTNDERKRLFAGLVRSLLLSGSIVTSIAKAKAVQPMVEKLVTRAKLGRPSDLRRVMRTITDREIAKRLMEDAKTRFAGRTSGYTRILKLGKREGDDTEMVQFSFVDARVVTEVIAPKKEVAKKEAVVVKEEKPKKQAAKKSVKKTVKK
jgi:large subunit ribosomal protein L17